MGFIQLLKNLLGNGGSQAAVRTPPIEAQTIVEESLAKPVVPLEAVQRSVEVAFGSSQTGATSSTETHSTPSVLTAYCVKCKSKVGVNNPLQVYMKNGKPAIQGTCSVCGRKVFRIGKA